MRWERKDGERYGRMRGEDLRVEREEANPGEGNGEELSDFSNLRKE